MPVRQVDRAHAEIFSRVRMCRAAPRARCSASSVRPWLNSHRGLSGRKARIRDQEREREDEPSLLAAAPMCCSAVKRCLNTACRGKGRGLQTSRPSRHHAINEAAEPVLWLRLHRFSPGGIL